MRLLQLNPTGDEAEALDLHPMVSVVTSLSDGGRAEVLRAAEALPRGEDPGYPGLLESHGILLDLTAAMLRLLDLRGGADLVVRAADLPMGSAPALPAGLTPLTAEQFLEITPPGEYPDLDRLRARQGQAREALTLLREAWDQAKQGLEDAQVARRRAELALESARAGSGGPDLRLVTEGLGPDESGSDIAPPNLREQVESRRRQLAASIQRMDRGINELGGIDVRPLQVLLDAIHNPTMGDMGPSEKGRQLADRLVALQREVESLEASLEGRGLGSAAAMTRLDLARVELFEAEKAMRPPEFTDQDRADLEAAHDEVIESERKARGRGGRKRLEDAIESEQSILDRMGFPTWSAYVMGSTLMGIDPAAEQRLEQARFEYEAAEQHWSNVAAMIEANPRHRELLDQIDTVHHQASQLLGGDDGGDLEERLRNHQEPQREVSLEELVDALAYQLELVGMGLPAASVTLDRVVLVAEAFLEEAAAIQDRIREIGDEKVEALTELQTLDDRLARLAKAEAEAEVAAPADAAPPEPEPEPVAEPVAESESDGATEQPGPDEPTAGEAAAQAALAELEAALAAAREDESDYADVVEARDSLVDAATQVETVATARLHKAAAEQASAVATAQATDLERFGSESGDNGSLLPATVTAIDNYLATRAAALQKVSFAGSVPLVLDQALDGLPDEAIAQVLDGLDRLADAVQVLVLSDHQAVIDWAERIGFQRAAIVRAPLAFA